MSKGLPCQGQRNGCRREPSRRQTRTTIRFGSGGNAGRCKLQLEHRNSFMLVAVPVPASQTTATVWRLITGETRVQACSVKQDDSACATTTEALHYQRRALATIHSFDGRSHCAIFRRKSALRKNRNAGTALLNAMLDVQALIAACHRRRAC